MGNAGDARVLEGHSFIVGAAVSLGGRDIKPGLNVYRFANRIPLLFEVCQETASLLPSYLVTPLDALQPVSTSLVMIGGVCIQRLCVLLCASFPLATLSHIIFAGQIC